ncbi:MAG: autotransporter-associated beta strand repeat-containing protein [Tepidisphaeraceae bacterium]
MPRSRSGPTWNRPACAIGAPAVTDGGKAWLFSFMDKAIAKGLRIDFIPIHFYRAGYTAAGLKAFLQDVYDRYHKPIWVTEFNNGANWTGGTDPTYAQEASVISSFIDMMDTTPWIERYSIYSNVEDVRKVAYSDGTLTPMGIAYRDNASPVGYQQEEISTTNTQGSGTARLPFEGNALDASGNGNNGQTVGGPTYAAGKTGQAIQLNGSNYVQLPATVGHGDSFSFAGWVNWNGGASWQRLFDFGTGTTQYMFLTPSSSGGKLRFAIKNGGAEQLLETNAVPTGTWTHVALTLGGGTAKLYVNGTLAATNSAVTIKPSDFLPTANYLGKSQYTADPKFAGKLDDVQVTDTVLTAAQIAALASGTNNAPQFASPTITRGPAIRNTAFSATIAGTATDADAGDTLTYSKLSGPSWLTVAADGTLSGTPTFANQTAQEFVVAVTDSKGATAYASLIIPLGEFYWQGDLSTGWAANSGGNTNWSSDPSANVDPGTIPTASSDVVFGRNSAITTTLDANVSARSVRVTSQQALTIGGTGNLTIGADGLQLTEGAGATTVNTTGQVVLGADQTWGIYYNSLTVASAIAGGAFGLTKAGDGSLTLAGNNTYTGTTTVASGVLYLGNGGTTGSLAGNIVNNGTLQVSRTTDVTLGGVISGTGYLRNVNTGRLILTASNTYTGGTGIGAISGPGVVRAAASGALGTGVVDLGPSGNATTARLELIGNSTLANAFSIRGRAGTSVAIQNVSGNNTLSGVLSLVVGGNNNIFQSDSGTLTLSGTVTNAGGMRRILTLQGAGNGNISGGIDNGTGSIAITKTGTGTWTLGGSNTYTGDTTVTAGTLALGNNERLANTANLVLNGGTFATAGFSETLGTLGLTNTSTMDLGSGFSRVTFSGAGTLTTGKTLTVTNWTAGADHVFVGTSAVLTAAQLAQINFAGVAAKQLSTGEVVPTTYNPKIYYWRGDVSGVWNANVSGNTNWSTDPTNNVDPGTLPDATTDVIFPAANAANFSATTLGANFSINSLTVAGSTATGIGGTNSLTIGTGGLNVASGAGVLTVNTTGGVVLGANQPWANASTNGVIVGSTISGTGTGLTKIGDGKLTFTADNTYTGGTSIGGGTLQLGNATAAGSVVGNIVNNSTLVFNRTAALTFTGTISGSGDLQQLGASTLTLTAANPYTGNTVIGAPGGSSVIRAAATDALGTGTISIYGNAGNNRLELAGGVTISNPITMSGRGNTVGQTASILNVSGNNTLAGQITLDVGGLFSTIQSDSGLLTLSAPTVISTGAITGSRGVTFGGVGNVLVSGAITDGTLTDGTAGGLLQIDKIGTGTLTLSADNTYTNGTTIWDSGGILAVTSDDALGSGTLTIGTGGNQLARLQLSNNIELSVSAITLAGQTQSTAATNARIENLSGNNTIVGDITFGAAGGSYVNVVSTAGTLTLAGDLTAAVVTGSRIVEFAGAGNIVSTGTTSNGTATVGIVKDGTGTLTLGNANTYTGGATLTSGTVAIGDNAAFGTGTVNFSGTSVIVQSVDATARTVANPITFSFDTTFGGTGNLLFTGAVNGGSLAKTFTVNNTQTEFSGVISGTGARTKAGPGTLVFSGANTYTGATSVLAGTLGLGAAERIVNTSAVTLGGGTLATNGFSETVGTLALTNNSGIDFGTGTSTLTFSGPAAFTAGKTLTVTNWTSGSDHLFVGSSAVLTATQLAQINFNGTAAQQLATGEVVPVAVNPPALTTFTVNNGNAQRSTVTSLTLVFSRAVHLGTGAIVLSGVSGTPANISYVLSPANDASTYTLTFPAQVGGSLADGGYQLKLNAALVTDVATGQPMAADDTRTFYRLFGDGDGNGTVNFNDFLALQTAFNTTSADPAYNAAFDANGDNKIDFNDFLAFQTHFGMNAGT